MPVLCPIKEEVDLDYSTNKESSLRKMVETSNCAKMAKTIGFEMNELEINSQIQSDKMMSKSLAAVSRRIIKRKIHIERDKQNDRFGFRMEAFDEGMYIWFVLEGSPAEAAGLKLGDKVLEFNCSPVSRYSTHQIMMECYEHETIELVIWPRRYREIHFALRRDINYGNRFGFAHHMGKITNIEPHSSADRESLMVDHNIIQINGTSLVGMDDGEINALIESETIGNVIELSILPSKPFGQLMRLAYVDKKFLFDVVRSYKMYE